MTPAVKTHVQTKRAKRLAGFAEQIEEKPRQPDRQRYWIHRENFLAEKRKRRETHVATAAANVRLQFQEGEVVLIVPDQVWKKDQERKQAPKPDPRRPEKLALRRQKEAGRYGSAPDQH